jgi:predicted dehydrogenase
MRPERRLRPHLDAHPTDRRTQELEQPMQHPLRFVFAGLRHPHGWAIWNRIRNHPGCRLAGVCEEDEQTRTELEQRPDVSRVYSNYENMLEAVPSEVVATADYYGNRGRIVIRALEDGRHVLADKPICASLEELEQIADLIGSRGLVLGCELDLRAIPQFHQARDLIQADEIGEIHAIQFGGQHPFFCYQRADWYLDKATYGGVINDIGIHGIDILQWMTGMPFTKVVAARNWPAFRIGGSPFRDAAQMMLTMQNGCGVLGDVSFVMPRSSGFRLPYYWEFTFWGSNGILRMGLNRSTLDIVREGSTDVAEIPVRQESVPDYFDHFLNELGGTATDLDTATILDASRKALTVQLAADRDQRDVPL